MELSLVPVPGNPGGNFGCCHGGSGGVSSKNLWNIFRPFWADPGAPGIPQVILFWEKAAHHTWNSKNKVDFGAPGIPAWAGFIFPLPLPEVVPPEKEFRRKNPQISVRMIPSRFLRAGINGRSGDRPEPTAGREGDRWLLICHQSKTWDNWISCKWRNKSGNSSSRSGSPLLQAHLGLGKPAWNWWETP